MEYQLAVFIGRFQPPHKSHIEVINQALELADEVLIIIGSANAARNIKNPFTFDERKQMILDAFPEHKQRQIKVEPIRDYFYNENNWVTDVQNKINQHSERDDSIVLVGHYKDSSSYYLNLFPQFEFIPAKNTEIMNSTDIRNKVLGLHNLRNGPWHPDFGNNNMIGEMDITWKNSVTPNVYEYIMKFTNRYEYQSLLKEFQFIKDYKDKWNSSPFPPTFVTVDSVVIKSGHILLVERKFEPGKGLLALPGGFIKQNESIDSAAIRELKEETKIRLDKQILKNNIQDIKVFDHPDRSLRGRTITHAYYINLGNGELPEIKASDDAAKVFWIPLMDLSKMEDKFYEDHFAMIQYFICRN